MTLLKLKRRPLKEQPPAGIDGHSNLHEGFDTLEALHLPPEKLIITGSFAMVLAGIEDRRANDLDLLVPPELFEVLAQTRALGDLLLTPVAPGKQSISISINQSNLLSGMLPVEFLPAAVPSTHWDAALGLTSVSHGYHHIPLETLATLKTERPHTDRVKAARDARDVERIRRHLRS